MSFAPVRPVLGLMLVLALAGGSAFAAPGPGAVGTAALDFDLHVFQGGSSTMTLSQHSGKVVMLFIIGYG